MDYIDGQTLTAYLREVKQLSLTEARPILWDIANALEYAHSRGLVHRDVKPSNIMLQRITSPTNQSATFRAMLMDFGIAKLTTNAEGLTRTGMLGTLEYVSPEQITSSPTIDGRTDVYALGIVAYQLLTGKLPYSGDSAGAILMAHMTRPVPDPRAVAPEMPESVALTIMRAMAKEPEERLPTASAFVQALDGN
jgi:eukaryotic-like serine/threonine-protein kinase